MHTLTTTWPICSSIAVILRRALTCPGRRPRAARMRMQRWPISNSTSVAALFPSSLTMQQSTLLAAFGVDFAIQVAGWLIAVVLKTDKTYDMFGSATFFSISLLTLALGGPASWRAALVSACVCAWAARLGTFLVVRVHKVGHDSRLQPYIDKPGSFLVLWLVQGMWVFVTLLPVLLLNTTPTAASVVWSDVAGPLLWAVGFTIESVADWQKFVFKMDPANKGRFIDSGLWSLSRYPNYCGEMAVWWGIAIASLPAMAGPWTWAAGLASPLFVTFLLVCVSGIPLQEKQAQQRWGNEVAYQRYRRSTRLLLPIPKLHHDQAA